MCAPIDDTFTMSPVPALHHPGEQGEGEAHRREVIHRHHALDVVGREVVVRRALRDAGVVDQHVDAAELGVGPARDVVDLVELGQVGHHHHDPGACPGTLEHLGQAVSRRGDRRHGGARPGERDRGGRPDPGRGAGDEHAPGAVSGVVLVGRGAGRPCQRHRARAGDRRAGWSGSAIEPRSVPGGRDHVDRRLVPGELAEVRAPLLHR